MKRLPPRYYEPGFRAATAGEIDLSPVTCVNRATVREAPSEGLVALGARGV